MILRVSLIVLLACTLGAHAHLDDVYASHSWMGTSAYYLWACNSTFRERSLVAAEQAGVRVLRIFLLSTEGRGSVQFCDSLPDVEVGQVGNYDDTILKRVDALMVDCKRHNIKLTIALHDRWSLGCWRTDVYVAKYNLPAVSDCGHDSAANNVSSFYANASARADFANRIAFILTHRNALMDNSTWRDLSDVIFSIEAENEAMGHLHVPSHDSWLCAMSTYMRSQCALSPRIAITTGGGEESSPASRHEYVALASCPAIDVLALHDYSLPVLLDKVALAATAARLYHKRYLVQEFGVSASTRDARAKAMRHWTNSLNDAKVPWLFWDLDRNDDPASFGVWADDETWTQAIVPAAQQARSIATNQSWPELTM